MLQRLALAGLLALAASPASALTCGLTTGYPFKDSTFTPQNFAATILNPGDGSNPCSVVPWQMLVDQSGVAYSSTHGLPVSQQGTWTFGLSGPIPAGTAVIGHVLVDSLPALPAGTNAIGTVGVSNFPAVQPVSAAALPLPAGAATVVAQTAGNTALGTIDADIKGVQPRAIASNAPSVSATGSLAASGDVLALAVDGMNTGLVQIATGSWTGAIAFEASADGGSTWTGVNMVPYAGGLATGTATAGGLWEMAVGGLTHLRLRATTAIAGGPVAVILRATNGLKSVRVGAPSGNPLPIATPAPSTIVTGQVKIATTGTAVCLPSNALVNGIAIKARATNAANLFVGPSGVTATYDGTGNGYPMEPGAAASFATANSSAVCLNGTAGDIASYEGN